MSTTPPPQLVRSLSLNDLDDYVVGSQPLSTENSSIADTDTQHSIGDEDDRFDPESSLLLPAIDFEQIFYPDETDLPQLREKDKQISPIWHDAEAWENIPIFSVITGPNGVGKSQLLSYIERFCRGKGGGEKPLYIYKSSNNDHELLYRQNQAFYLGNNTRFVAKPQEIKLINQVKEYIRRLLANEEITIADAKTPERKAYEIAKLIVDNRQEKAEEITDPEIITYAYAPSVENLKHPQVSVLRILEAVFKQYEDQKRNLMQVHRDITLGHALRTTYQKIDSSESISFDDYIQNEKNLSILLTTIALEKVGQAPWVEINKLFEKNKLDLRISYEPQEFLGWGRDSAYLTLMRSSSGSSEPIHIQPNELSSGEFLILEMLSWQYYTSGLSSDDEKKAIVQKVKLILLDEPDRHFDPELSRIFMSCLKHMAEKNGIQIIMTTHRTDTLALAPKGSIFTIKADETGKRLIRPTPLLGALFNLTPNLREITHSIDIIVHTEASADASVYERIYRQLLRLSNKKREEGRMNPQIKPFILSRRFPLSFYSAAMKEGGRGGGCQVLVQTIQRNIQALRHLDTLNTSSLIDSSIRYPFGVIDADTYLSPKKQIDVPSRINVSEYPDVAKQVVCGRRYSLENYLYDPAFLFSLLNKQEIAEWFTKDQKLCECALECHKLLMEREEESAINDAFQAYFRRFLALFIFNPDNEASVREHYHSIYHYFGVSKSHKAISTQSTGGPTLPQNNMSEIITRIQQLQSLDPTPLSKDHVDELEQIRVLSGKLAKLGTQLKNGIYDKLANSSEKKSVNLIEKLTSDLGLTEKVQAMEQKEKENTIIQCLMERDAKMIEILSPEGNSLYQLPYPGFFIYARGHNIEDCMHSCVTKENNDISFNTWLIDTKIAGSSDDLLLPKDLVDVFYELNQRVRDQARTSETYRLATG